MARSSKTTKASARIAAKAKKLDAHPANEAEAAEFAALPKSVVKPTYKAVYRSRENSMKGRNCADWLAQTLAGIVLSEERKLIVSELEAVCHANNVPATYENRSKGWEGRMRMTLGLRLRPVVAAQGFLAVKDGKKVQKLPAPASFIAAYKK
jgi:hypothetical protein